MASREAFLPVPTEEDIERNAVPQYKIPTYSPSGPASASTGNVVEHMNVEASVGDDAFPSTAGQHMMCCNCCCDFRRAVMIVNAVQILLKLLEMLGIAVIATYVSKNIDSIENDMDDDEAVKQLDGVVKGGFLGMFELIFEVLETVAVGLYACGIYGALRFKEWGIITAACGHTFQLFLGIISMDFGNIIVMALFLYPHYYMLKLMRAGIMTEFNYHKFASCCGDRAM